MKKPLLFGIISTVCIIIVAFVFAQFYPEGMISYWKFEGSGATAYDSVDTNDGTLINGPVWTTGKVGRALDFDGVNDYVEIVDTNPSLNLGNITVSAWIFPRMPSGSGAAYHYIDKRTPGPPWNFEEYTAYVRGNGQFEVGVITTGGLVYFPSSTGVVNMNEWSHVAFTWDGGTLKVFHNGTLIGQTSGSGNIVSNSQPIILGTRADLTPYFFDGLLDEVAIYNRALTEDEILLHYENGLSGSGYEVECVIPPSGMVSWWPGDEEAKDIVGGNNGTLHGTTYATGKVSQAFIFDGVNDYVDVGDIGVTDDWTIDFWAKLDTVAPRIQYPIGISTRLSTHFGSGVFMAFTDDGNAWGLYDGNQNWQKPYLHLVLGSPVSADVWYHIAVIKSGPTYTLYLNGNYENSESILDDIDITNLQIGRRLDPGGGFGHFDGLIDEVEIYDRALSADDIQAIYNAGSAGKCKITNQPPVAVCKDITIECQATITAADVDGGSHDPDEGDPITRSIDNIGPFTTLGEHYVNLTVTDESGEFDTCQATVIVEDTTPPVISVSVTPNILRPPNHKMVNIIPNIVVSDNCDTDPTVVVTSVEMNEGDGEDTYHPIYDSTLGAGHTTDDIQIDDDGNIYLRAERSGKGDGRIYTITYTATDESGNSTTATATVTVPHDQKQPQLIFLF